MFLLVSSWDVVACHGVLIVPHGRPLGCIDRGYCMMPNNSFPACLWRRTCGSESPTLRCRWPLTAAGGAVQAHEHPRGGGAGGGAVGALGAAVGTAARPAQQVGCVWTLHMPLRGLVYVRKYANNAACKATLCITATIG